MGVKILTAVFLVDTLGFILKKKKKRGGTSQSDVLWQHYLALVPRTLTIKSTVEAK